MTEIEYEVRLGDLAAFNEHQLIQTEAVRKILRRYQVTIPGLLALSVFFLIFYFHEAVSAAFVGLLAILWVVLGPAFFRWKMRARMMRMYSMEDMQRLAGRYTLRVEPDALVEIAPEGESRVDWADILRVEGTKKYVFIFVDHQTALIVPRKTVSRGSLHDFVREANLRIDAMD